MPSSHLHLVWLIIVNLLSKKREKVWIIKQNKPKKTKWISIFTSVCARSTAYGCSFIRLLFALFSIANSSIVCAHSARQSSNIQMQDVSENNSRICVMSCCNWAAAVDDYFVFWCAAYFTVLLVLLFVVGYFCCFSFVVFVTRAGEKLIRKCKLNVCETTFSYIDKINHFILKCNLIICGPFQKREISVKNILNDVPQFRRVPCLFCFVAVVVVVLLELIFDTK